MAIQLSSVQPGDTITADFMNQLVQAVLGLEQRLDALSKPVDPGPLLPSIIGQRVDNAKLSLAAVRVTLGSIIDTRGAQLSLNDTNVGARIVVNQSPAASTPISATTLVSIVVTAPQDVPTGGPAPTIAGLFNDRGVELTEIRVDEFVLIHGQNFRSTAAENEVTVAGSAASIDRAAASQLRIRVPSQAGSHAGQRVEVRVKTSDGFDTREVGLLAGSPGAGPVISRFSVNGQAVMDAQRGSILTIEGSGFATTNSGNKVRFDGIEATPGSSASGALSVTVPRGLAENVTVAVTVTSTTTEGVSRTSDTVNLFIW